MQLLGLDAPHWSWWPMTGAPSLKYPGIAPRLLDDLEYMREYYRRCETKGAAALPDDDLNPDLL